MSHYEYTGAGRVEASEDIDHNGPVLYRYNDAVALRNATPAELAASQEAAESDGGAGVIEVDGVDCYVQE